MSRVLLAAVALAVATLAPLRADAAAPPCIGIPQAACLLPFPNDATQTVRDAATPTGRRVRIPAAVAPRNAKGVRIDLTDQNRADGFSPGGPVLLRIPGVSTGKAFAATGLPNVTRLDRSLAKGSRLVLADASTGKRVLAWAELDLHVSDTAAGRLVVIHPGRNLTEGRTYLVAVRGIGRRAPGSAAFARRADVSAAMRRAGVGRDGLYIAWTFTVASERSLTGGALAIRDDAFRQLGDPNLADGLPQGRPPAYAITGVKELTPEEDPRIARVVTGTVTVPCYLDRPGCPPGARFNVASTGGKDALPARMASEDIPNAAAILGDLGKFPSLADRLQQGLVDGLYLGRLMRHPDGLAKAAPFQAGGAPVVDPSHLYYDSNSQGALFGGALTALAPDYTQAVLGVASMHYATLLPRSTDFKTYSAIYYPAYKGAARLEGLALVQMLWDRGETAGYAAHMTTDPLPGTPAHRVLLHAAVGDLQVSNWTVEAEARTIGARTNAQPLDRGRSLARSPLFGIPRIGAYPYAGSALIYWDSGKGHNAPAPADDTSPKGQDPHEDPRATPAARDQKSAFLQPDGKVIDVCGGRPCHTSAFLP